MRTLTFDPTTDGQRIRSDHHKIAQKNDRARKLRQTKIRNDRRQKATRLGWEA